MDHLLAEVTKWLLEASSQIPDQYFQLPVAGMEEPEYRERVYCYELYHRWRCSWPKDFPFSLSGEIDKTGHPLIRNGPKPDFLVHVLGEMTNLLIVEVKAANVPVRRICDDLQKLTHFRRDLVVPGQHGNYQAAYLWLYGLSIDLWPDFRETLLLEAGRRDPYIDCGLINCFVHPQPNVAAVSLEWH
jgi:hypothetical protein